MHAGALGEGVPVSQFLTVPLMSKPAGGGALARVRPRIGQDVLVGWHSNAAIPAQTKAITGFPFMAASPPALARG
ncbi:MAG: hypothetical protein R3B82_28090 [Sandaracinaceae bacterium]